MKKVLALPAFRRLLVLSTLNELAQGLGAVALALYVYQQTGSAFGATAFFLCAEFAPAFFSPFLVARLDRSSIRRALLLLYVLEGLVFAIVASLLGNLAVASLLALVLLDGTLGATARVLTRSAWTSITSPMGSLREANALVHGARSLCFMAGPALGGIVVAASGTRSALYIDVCLFVVMTVLTATARGFPDAVPERRSGGRLREAVRRVSTEPLLRRLLGLQAIGLLFFTITIPVDVIFARHTLHAGPGGYGLLLGVWGGGTIVGTVFYARWRTLSSRTLLSVGTVVIGAGFLTMALAPTIGIAIAGSAVSGIGTGVQGAAIRVAVQEAAPVEWMSLVLSLNESMQQAVPGAGILLGGALAAAAGARTALATAAVGAFVVALLAWVRLAGQNEVASPRDVSTDDARALPAVQRQT
jgi:MFS family permease